jgi:hypothetical protein
MKEKGENRYSLHQAHHNNHTNHSSDNVFTACDEIYAIVRYKEDQQEITRCEEHARSHGWRSERKNDFM